VLAEYFDNPDFTGQPKIARTEPRPYLLPGVADPRIAAAFPQGGYAVRWTGTLRPPVTGTYLFRAQAGRNAMRVFLNGREPVSGVQLRARHAYRLRVEFVPQGPPPEGSMHLAWIPPAAPLLTGAVKMVKKSDVALVFVGLNPSLEGEEMPVKVPGFLGGDRTNIKLPDSQERLIEAVVATGKPVVVILTSGSAVAVNYAAEHAAAVLAAWYGGEEAGTAIAETLAGDNNPAGRLPVTFYRSVEQLPPFEDYSMDGRTYRYFHSDPLYGFGFGLSYSAFQYSDLHAGRTQQGAHIRASVKNVSGPEGDEVAELYVSGGGAIRTLEGFTRIHLRPGEVREVEFTIPAAGVPEGAVRVSVGGGQPSAGIPHVEGTL